MLGAEQQALAGKLELLRAEVEQRVAGVDRDLETLAQGQRQAATDRDEVDARLAVLEQQLAAAESGRDMERARVVALEASLAELSQRLETRCNQLKFLQDSEREQLQALKSALAEATSRLETSDEGLRKLLDAANDRTAHLETVQEDVAGHLNALAHGLGQLRTTNTENALKFESERAATVLQLEATGKLVRALEQRIELEHDAQQALHGEMLARWRGHDALLRQVRITAFVALGLLLLMVVVLVV